MIKTDLFSPDPWQNPRLAGRVPELDGIRGVAILMVVVWHAFQNTIQVTVGSWQAYAFSTLRFTWTGVDLFFVLSGFLIGGILYDAKPSQNYYRTFYSRRLFRILPLYLVWLALFLVGLYSSELNHPGAYRLLFNNAIPAWSYPLFLQNFFMAYRQTFGAEWLSVTWSLAIEEQFYLVLPLIIRVFNREGITRTAIAAITLAPVMRLALVRLGNPYFGPYTLLWCRADALGFGVLAALACRDRTIWEWLLCHRMHIYAAFLSLGFCVIVLGHYQQGIYSLGLTCLAAFYVLLLLLSVASMGPVAAIFRIPALMKLGIIAYGVYIFHQGINRLFHLLAFGSIPRIDGLDTLAVTLLALGTVLLLAVFSWRRLEMPLIRYAQARFRY